jgi:membrane-associated phospholipid phosphatase
MGHDARDRLPGRRGPHANSLFASRAAIDGHTCAIDDSRAAYGNSHGDSHANRGASVSICDVSFAGSRTDPYGGYTPAEHPAAHHANVINGTKGMLRVNALNRSSFLVVFALAIGIAVLATALQGSVLWNVETVRVFQGHGGLRFPMEAITTLGSEDFLVLLVSLVFWCINKPLGIDMALLLVICGATNITLKALLQTPRPFWSNLSLRLTSAESFSTPSGHAANSTALLGYLAWWLAGRRPQGGQPQDGRPQGSPLRGFYAPLLLLCIFLVCLSRVYLGVHFPGDVIWGCAEGIIVLLAYIKFKPRVAAWLGGRSLGTQVALPTAAAAAILALNLLFLALQQAPRSGAEPGLLYAQAHAESLAETGSVAGLLLGAGIGLALERRYVRFTTTGSAARRVLRYLMGLVGLVAIQLVLELLPKGETLALSLALQVVRQAATALWVVFAWPWLFVRVGLGTVELPTPHVGSVGN